ncbi:MAG: O-antigen polymerase [Pseudomonadota bacterium]
MATQRIGSVTVHPHRLLGYLTYCLVLVAVFFWTLRFLPYPSQTTAMALAFTVGAVVPLCLVFREHIDLIEPIYPFSAMYFFFFPAAVYFILTDFQFSKHNLIADPLVRNGVLVRSLILVALGYLAILSGYFAGSRQARRRPISFEESGGIPDWLYDIAIAVLFGIGLLNFVYLVSTYPGGLYAYYAEMGLREHRLDKLGEGVSTAGLQLIVASVWLCLFTLMRRLRREQTVSTLRYVFVACVVVLAAAALTSQGRLFQTVSYCLVVAAMVYAFSSSPTKNRSMILTGIGLFAAGLALYFGRLVSVLLINQPEIFSRLGFSGVVNTFFTALNRLILDSGNVTDLTSLMNTVAYWEQDYPFLYGESFFAVLSRLLPGLEFRSVAEITQPDWATGTGAWPPTFVGELYANFGSTGVICGMLVAGFLLGRIYRSCASSGSFWLTFVLCTVAFRFAFVLPKGETVNLNGVFWLLAPPLLTVGALQLVAATLQASKARHRTGKAV